MVKKNIIFCFFVLFFQCQNKNIDQKTFVNQNINFIYTFNNSIVLNFEKRTIELKYKNKIYVENFVLNLKEINQLEKSFFNNKIDFFSGEFFCVGTVVIMPPSNNKLIILKSNKPLSQLIINNYFQSDSNIFETDEERVINFNTVLKRIVEKNKNFIKISDSLNNLLILDKRKFNKAKY